MSIPTERQIKALRMIKRHEQRQSGFLNRDDAEECENNGWAEAQPGGGYRLTLEGRRILKAVGEEVEED